MARMARTAWTRGRADGAAAATLRGAGETGAAARPVTVPVVSVCPRAPLASHAAPSATACFGWASTATGRSTSELTSWATIGIRDEPPTSSTECSSSGVHPADRMARFNASTEPYRAGRTMASSSDRVRRTSVTRFGSSTGIDVSVSDDSASLAWTHSSRSRATAATAAGSSSLSSDSLPPRASRTWLKTAASKSMPPRRSMPSGCPRMSKPVPVLRSTAASKVPPPRSYTATMAPASMRCCCA